MSKHSNLVTFINMLLNHKCNIVLIAIQETWEIPHSELIQIPGFNFVSKNRTSSKGGGVAFYIKNSLKFKILNNLSHFTERVFECITIELELNKKKIVASNIYKSPNPINGPSSEHNDIFIDSLDTHLYNLSLLPNDIYVFTDSNINLLSINNNNTVAQYFETIYSNGFTQKVGKATRIAGNSYSLIDHILCKSNNNNITSGTILTDFSDHFTNMLVIPNSKVKVANQFKHVRNFSKTKMDTFKNALRNLRWNSVYTSQDVNHSFNEFWNTFYTGV